MTGYTMWIVLGVLVAIVAGFLIVSTVLDKRKNKRIKNENDKLQEEIKFAGFNISQEIIKIIKTNEKRLSNFVVSIGKQKMSEINLLAKKSLKDIKESRNMSLIKENDENEQSEIFLKHFNSLFKEKSNNWSKRNKEDISFFKNYKKPSEQIEEEKTNKKRWKKGKKNEFTK